MSYECLPECRIKPIQSRESVQLFKQSFLIIRMYQKIRQAIYQLTFHVKLSGQNLDKDGVMIFLRLSIFVRRLICAIQCTLKGYILDE